MFGLWSMVQGLCRRAYFCTNFPVLRLPMPSETKINDFANVSGYTCGNMQDFQKIFACLDMEDGGHQDSSFLRKVANAGKGKGVFSTKLTLAMSQSAWRLSEGIVE